MKHLLMIFITVLVSGVMLSSCGIGGYWMNGYPFPGPVKPYLQYWEKPGVSPEGRRKDSVACGAGDTDYVGWGEVHTKAERRPEEKNDFAARERLSRAWVECMRSKGYRYQRTAP